jgi:hypothetical protein
MGTNHDVPAGGLLDLSESLATRAQVDHALEPNSLLVYFGHGGNEGLGADGDRLIDAENIERLRGGIVAAMSCCSASRLGQIAVEKGVSAFIGFEDILPVYPEPTSALSVCVTGALRQLAHGATAQATVNLLMDDLLEIRDSFLVQPKRVSNYDRRIIGLCAHTMRVGLRLVGNGAANVDFGQAGLRPDGRI